MGFLRKINGKFGSIKQIYDLIMLIWAFWPNIKKQLKAALLQLKAVFEELLKLAKQTQTDFDDKLCQGVIDFLDTCIEHLD